MRADDAGKPRIPPSALFGANFFKIVFGIPDTTTTAGTYGEDSIGGFT